MSAKSKSGVFIRTLCIILLSKFWKYDLFSHGVPNRYSFYQTLCWSLSPFEYINIFLKGNWNRVHTYPYQMQQQLYSRNYDVSNEGSMFPTPLPTNSLIANTSLTPTSTTRHQSSSPTPSPRLSDNVHEKTTGFSYHKDDDHMVSCQYKDNSSTGKESNSYQKEQLTSPSEVLISRNVSMNYSITEHKLNYQHKNFHNANNIPYLHSSLS